MQVVKRLHRALILLEDGQKLKLSQGVLQQWRRSRKELTTVISPHGNCCTEILGSFFGARCLMQNNNERLQPSMCVIFSTYFPRCFISSSSICLFFSGSRCTRAWISVTLASGLSNSGHRQIWRQRERGLKKWRLQLELQRITFGFFIGMEGAESKKTKTKNELILLTSIFCLVKAWYRLSLWAIDLQDCTRWHTPRALFYNLSQSHSHHPAALNAHYRGLNVYSSVTNTPKQMHQTEWMSESIQGQTFCFRFESEFMVKTGRHRGMQGSSEKGGETNGKVVLVTLLLSGKTLCSGD